MIIRRRLPANRRPTDRPRVLTAVRRVQHQPAATRDEIAVPTLYVLNAAAITKPHAVQHLGSDLRGYEVGIAVGLRLKPINKRRERRVFTDTTRSVPGTLSSVEQLANDADVQENFDRMYYVMFELLNQFYPELEIMVTSSDPHYVTAKAMLRRNNRPFAVEERKKPMRSLHACVPPSRAGAPSG